MTTGEEGGVETPNGSVIIIQEVFKVVPWTVLLCVPRL